ncbi:MAG: glycosyltransferase family 2 protein, partial [Chloroflexi bacterium]|nr:glycosyltransferase family 2 protein [Chloroflexota bacterium]
MTTTGETGAVTPFVTVVVLNWNGLRLLPPCLEAVAQTDYPAGQWETVVVDNASTDGSAEWVEANHPWVRVRRNPGNWGFGRGNNPAMRDAPGPFVVLLNSDTRVRPGWLRALVETMDAEPRAGAATAKLLFPDDGPRRGQIQNAGGMLLPDGSGRDRDLARGVHRFDRERIRFEERRAEGQSSDRSAVHPDRHDHRVGIIGTRMGSAQGHSQRRCPLILRQEHSPDRQSPPTTHLSPVERGIGGVGGIGRRGTGSNGATQRPTVFINPPGPSDRWRPIFGCVPSRPQEFVLPSANRQPGWCRKEPPMKPPSHPRFRCRHGWSQAKRIFI